MFFFTVGLRELQSVPYVPAIHNAEGHDQGHYARPRLHGSLPRGGPIARGAQIVEELFHRPQEVESPLEPTGA